ncbi:hypothetical protein BXZ70DRAFT_1079578 [Cristinia sonorae]|uniref:Uncharacterized protein n=1 Tax=Cristinia sonorae TaxID=1940300 RepID=A0A8K0UIB2_9AGAR|nr:hypothetical protein BXZ70DRAFT_1079578 [Cristinia sonorae]
MVGHERVTVAGKNIFRRIPLIGADRLNPKGGVTRSREFDRLAPRVWRVRRQSHIGIIQFVRFRDGRCQSERMDLGFSIWLLFGLGGEKRGDALLPRRHANR